MLRFYEMQVALTDWSEQKI